MYLCCKCRHIMKLTLENHSRGHLQLCVRTRHWRQCLFLIAVLVENFLENPAEILTSSTLITMLIWKILRESCRDLDNLNLDNSAHWKLFRESCRNSDNLNRLASSLVENIIKGGRYNLLTFILTWSANSSLSLRYCRKAIPKRPLPGVNAARVQWQKKTSYLFVKNKSFFNEWIHHLFPFGKLVL
jgi:hypothetical protein